MFNPAYPPNFNSLNGLLMAELPSHCPSEFLGKKGYDFLSSSALNRYIDANLSALELAPMDESSLRLAYFERLETGNPAAIRIAEQMGQALGAILLTLQTGTATNRLANPSKDSAYWDYWAQVQQVYIGGGLTSGKAGQIIAHEAQKLCSSMQIHPVAYPRQLPLLGAARYVPTGESALVLDFGGTMVKRAIAYYGAEGLTRLELLETLPFTAQADNPQAIFASFLNILTEAYRPVDASIIPVSIAAYVDESGQPYLNQHGIYMQMASLSENLPKLLSDTLSQKIGREVQVKLLHDGTAAAAFFSPLDHAAVLTIGTAIGAGYPVFRSKLRPLAKQITVESPSP